MALILYEMGLIDIRFGNQNVVLKQAWDEFKGLFVLTPCLFDMSETRFKAMNGSRMKKWFVRIGRCEHTPSQIMKKNLLPPSKLTSRETSAFVCTELMGIYRESEKLEMLFLTSHYNDKKDNSVGVSTVAETNDESSESIEPKINSTKYPFISKFQLPFNDNDLMSKLLRELIQFKREENPTTLMYNVFILPNPTNPSYSNAYIEVPKGKSASTVRVLSERIK
mmetsp:Transcript_21863/g.30723  ORF Transcript_21863/g.30723 Transcript_21863/m.30723 type:complete len:223 (+) Transcript_21863:171-839(+)